MGLARLVGDWWWLLAAPVFVGARARCFAFVSPYLEPDRTALDDPAAARDRRDARAARARRARSRSSSRTCSSDTSLPNAEAMGFGPSRRVVLWDTLLDGRFTPREVAVVIAHELGHVARDHILKSIALVRALRVPGRVRRSRA